MNTAISLTSTRISLDDGTSAFPFEWKGHTVPVRDSALDILKVIEHVGRFDISDAEKNSAIPQMLFADPDEAFLLCDFSYTEFTNLVRAVLNSVCGIDPDGGSDTKVWDIQEDASLIRVSMRMAYGIEWNQIRGEMSWTEFVSLIACLPFETPLGRAMYYRNPENRPKGSGKHVLAEQQHFDEMHQKLALGITGSHNVENACAVMDDLALALLSKAR